MPHAAPQGMCDNIINALMKIVATQKKDGDSAFTVVVSGLREKSWRKSVDGLRLFIAVENIAVVGIGDLKKKRGPRKWYSQEIFQEVTFGK